MFNYRVLPLQSEPAECGLIAVAAIASLLGVEISPEGLKNRYGVTTRGVKLSQIVRMLRDIGFDAQPVKIDLAQCRDITTPTIALWRNNHFVVVERANRKSAKIFDPALGWRYVTARNLQRNASEIFIQARKAPISTSFPLRKPVPVLAWLGQMNWRRGLTSVLFVAMSVQVAVLALPMLAARVINSALAENAHPIPIALLLYAGLTGVVVLTRSSLHRISAKHSARLSKSLLVVSTKLLLARPVSYFFRNSAAVLASKVQSVNTIRAFVLRIVSSTSVHALSALFSFAMLAAIQPLLAALVCVTRATTVVLDARAARWLAAVGDERFRSFAEQNRTLTEIGRCAPTIKVNRAVPAVLRRFKKVSSRALNHDVRYENVRQTRTDYSTSIGSIEQTLILAIGVYFLQRGSISMGEFVAIGMYREIIVGGFREAQESFSDYLNVRTALARIEDLGIGENTSCEDRGTASADPTDAAAIGACVRVSDVAFRYSAFDDDVLDCVSLEVRAGECVAIVAPSGAGKSTLAHIITGSLVPTRGSVEIDGIPISDSIPISLRTRIGTVMQSDHLLTGTVAENITMFRRMREDEIHLAAQLACIHEFIMSLPMRYETVISDDFDGLSGGQRQRILIARALASKPRLLVMDEATSFLDAETEKQVAVNIAELRMTRVVFAHRDETIRRADRVLTLASLQKKTHERAESPQANMRECDLYADA